MPDQPDQPKSTKRRAADDGFSDAERAAMRERAKELKAAAKKADGESAVLAKIAEMDGLDRELAEQLHALIKANAPTLLPRTWYGMPAYTLDGKVICFFQAAQKFEARYASFGFNDAARLDDGHCWPTAFALTAWTPAIAAQLAALVRKAVAG